MPAKGTTFDTDLLKLIFNGTTIANLADNTLTSPLTNLYVSLHTGSPLVGGSQNTNEAAYTSYARVAVPRADNGPGSAGWRVNGSSVTPGATISFPACTGVSTETETHFAVGTAPNVGDAGKILYFGTITPNINIANGVTAQLTTASSITEA